MPDFVDPTDFMIQAASLRRHGMKRAFFDPSVPSHIESMKHYMEHGTWLTQFYPEDPYIDVPMTVFRKYAGYQLDILVTTQQKYEALERAGLPALVITTRRSQDEMENAEVAQREEGFQRDIHEATQERA